MGTIRGGGALTPARTLEADRPSSVRRQNIVGIYDDLLLYDDSIERETMKNV
jgi:hypothetical protein